MLLRHWPLLDALHHTPELLGLLRTFKEGGSGRQIVTHVLATLGIPLLQVRAWPLGCVLRLCVRSPRLASMQVPADKRASAWA